MVPKYKEIFNERIKELKSEGRYRVFANLERHVGDFPTALYRESPDSPPRKVVVWCSNDYLGMGQNPIVLDAMSEAVETYGAGAGGTRNISGTHNLHVLLERELADLHGKESALIFTSGYLANETALSALSNALPDCVILSDECNHASMIQGMRQSKAKRIIFRHNDLGDLRAQLKSLPKSAAKIIAFESVHSMDGDISPIEEICDLADQYESLTYLDETHAVGLYGAHGGGVAEKEGLLGRIDMIEGGLGKAYGVVGGFVTGGKEMVDVVRSYGSGFIFTTSLPPVNAAGALASVRYLKAHSEERTLMHERANLLKAKLRRSKLPLIESPSHIIPLLVGESNLCREVAARLMKDHAIYIQPINYPTVPRGTERLRITPTPLHTLEMTDTLVAALNLIWEDLGLPRTVPAHWSRGEESAAV